MPKYIALRPMRYLNRMLQVGDEFEVMPGDARWATSRGRAGLVEDAPRSDPGRPPKAKEEPEVPFPTEPEPDPTPDEEEWDPKPLRRDLLARAKALGIELPKTGYVPNDDLAALVAEAEKHVHEDEGRF